MKTLKIALTLDTNTTSHLSNTQKRYKTFYSQSIHYNNCCCHVASTVSTQPLSKHVLFPTCVSLCVAAQGPLRCTMIPVFPPVSMSGSSPLLGYTLHVVVVCTSFVSVAPPRPAVAQRRGGALHGTAVIDGLREKERTHEEGREGEREGGIDVCFHC